MFTPQSNLKRALVAGALSLSMAFTLASCGGGSGSGAGAAEGSAETAAADAGAETAGANAFVGRWVYSESMPDESGDESPMDMCDAIFSEDGTVTVNSLLDAPMFQDNSGTYEVSGNVATMTLETGGRVTATLSDDGQSFETIPEIFGATGDNLTFNKAE